MSRWQHAARPDATLCRVVSLPLRASDGEAIRSAPFFLPIRRDDLYNDSRLPRRAL